MDIVTHMDGKLTGLNGLFEHIVSGVINDPRWRLEYASQQNDRQKMVILTFCQPGSTEVTRIEMQISEYPYVG